MRMAIDCLAGAAYPNAVLRYLPKGWGLGIFAQTFGDALPLVNDVGNLGTCPFIRVHLCWEDSHVYGPVQEAQAYREAARYEALKTHSIIELSPFCEHNRQDIEAVLRKIHEIAPSCVPVNTPWQGCAQTAFKLEKHASILPNTPLKGVSNFSFDGKDCLANGVQRWIRAYAPSDACFLWTPLLNRLSGVNDKTPRDKRTIKPTAATFKALVKAAQ